jgi:dipeptidyl aminopeptidase/acylaminoacyl peptidase
MSVMNKDGSNQQQLIDADVRDAAPSWSPDSKHVAITSLPDQILIVNVEDLTSYELADYAWLPFWSPDGRTIGYSGLDVGNIWSIYLMDADGTNKRNLTPDHNTITDFWFANWSPDGSQISFTSTNPVGSIPAVYTMDVQGHKTGPIISGIDSNALWSPHGNYLASVVNCQRGKGIQIGNVNDLSKSCIPLQNLGDIVLSTWIN